MLKFVDMFVISKY